MQLEAACISNTGKIRTNNEDNFYFNGRYMPLDHGGLVNPFVQKMQLQSTALYCVFDGMGGEECGEIASGAAAQMTLSFCQANEHFIVPSTAYLNGLCQALNNAVVAESKKIKFGRMGTTMVSLYFLVDQVYVCNVGDSRAFRLRDNELLQLSTDHVEHLPPQSKHKPGLTQYIGIDPDEMVIEPFIAKGNLKRGDQYLICSDGITDMLTNIEICATLKNHASTGVAVRKLVELAMDHGGRDNITAILCRIR